MDLFWEKKDWVKNDRHLQLLQNSPFQRKFEELRIEPGIAMIRGPRQIGKSSWAKTLLLQSLKDGKKTFYFSCEEIIDFQTLSQLLKQLTEYEVIILDEISFVNEWWRAVKKFTDQYHRISIILTGSHAHDLKKGMDQMPGRWMKTKGEYFLLPMLFDEWCKMRQQAKWPELDRLSLLKLYFKVGGFPTALAESGPNGINPTNSRKIYHQWLRGDVVKLGKQELYLKELLGQIVKTMGSTISLQGLAQKTQLMSHHTAIDYISVLESCFAMKTLYCYNPETDAFHLKKQKKLYFTDPLIYWVAQEWSDQKAPENFEEQIAEMVAHEEISRRVSRIGYFSNQSGEIDFIHDSKWALEVKWTPLVTNVSKAFKKLPLPEKLVWTQQNFLKDWSFL